THYRDASIPFVFCGINWSYEEYGFPYTNTTGIIEVAPIGLLLVKAVNILGGADSAVYIGADTLTERKNLQRFATAAHDFEITLQSHLVGTSSDWMKAYKAAQSHDFLIIGSNSGINDWDNTDIKEFVHAHTRKLSATNHRWMLPYTILGFTKVPEEQGVWAGKAAIAILNGARPNDIPIVSNRKWDLWINDVIVKSSGIEIPDTLARIAKKTSEQKQ
ncbi:MAG: ABC transporter substrate-binding protein, partial [Candidatus Thiodiazotropha sp. (ex Notomyrtea botanica)]|nr:ABC transporter substrate-binding protein [Candidatus Thiodiazotropha sp. (ex Notomyrtea botanica)]